MTRWEVLSPVHKHPVVVRANDPDEMNDRLLAAGIWPEDCYGGFSLRSTQPHRGKLSEIKWQVERVPSTTGTDQAHN